MQHRLLTAVGSHCGRVYRVSDTAGIQFYPAVPRTPDRTRVLPGAGVNDRRTRGV